MVAVVDNKLLRRSQMAFNPIHPRGIRGDKDHFDIGLLTPLDDFGPMPDRMALMSPSTTGPGMHLDGFELIEADYDGSFGRRLIELLGRVFLVS